MARRPELNWTSLPPGLTHEGLLRELNRRLGHWKQAVEDFPAPFALAAMATTPKTYTVDPRASTYFTLDVTVAAAVLTIANPSYFPTAQGQQHAAPGQDLWFDIKNSSGGAITSITWGAEFVLDGSFVKPANTKRRVVGFTRVGLLWVQRGAATGDM